MDYYVLRKQKMSTSSPLPRNVGFLIQSSGQRTPGSGGASGSMFTPTKKQQQSQLKTVVHQFGDLMLSWREYTEVCAQLLSSLLSLVSTMVSIEKTCRSNRQWRRDVMLCPTPTPADPHYPRPEIVALLAVDGSEDHQIMNFADLETRLNGALLVDAESVLAQLRSASKRLGDVLLAMRLKCEEAQNGVLGQPLDVFERDAIFNAEHVLSIVSLCQHYQLEYERKYVLIEQLTGGGNDESASFSITSSDYVELLEKVLDEWADSSEVSLLNNQLVEAFMLQNNITSS